MMSNQTPVMPPNEPASRNPGLMIAVVVSVVIALGVAGYFATKGGTLSVVSGSNESKQTSQTSSAIGVFNHVAIGTDRTGANEDSTLTYLQGHDDETEYCTKFDVDSDGAAVDELSEPTTVINIESTVGTGLSPTVITSLTKVMSIDDGLLTDLCSHNDDVYALVLSADLQTMTPYRLAGSDTDAHMVAYNPILTPGGYGALYFDHVQGYVVVGTNMKHDDETVEWQYYALDRSSGATDLIESCDQNATISPATLSCSREYTP
jgi:hypothetical protein